jgi:hypothetical protein
MPEAEQRSLLTSPPPADPADARVIAGAVEALLLDAASEAKPGVS